MLKTDEFIPAQYGSPEEGTAAAKEREHLDYLERMATEGIVSPALAEKAKLVWIAARDATGGKLRIPAAAAFDGGLFEYHWMSGDHRVSCEIPAAGPADWMYLNVATDELWGDEIESGADLPRTLASYLTRIATGTD